MSWSAPHLVTILEPGDDGRGVPRGGALELELRPPRRRHAVRGLDYPGRGLHPQLRLLADRLPVHVPRPALVAPLVTLLQARKLKATILQDSIILPSSIKTSKSKKESSTKSLIVIQSILTCLISSISWGWDPPRRDTGG